LPLHTRRKVIEDVLNEILGLHNRPKAAVHSVHKLAGKKKKKEKKKKKKKEKKRKKEKKKKDKEKKKNK